MNTGHRLDPHAA